MEGRDQYQNFTLENFTNFKLSKDPVRIMYFGSGGEWKDFPLDQFYSLRSSFTQGTTTVEVPMDGKPSVVEFLRMMQSDLATGASRSVAWIDVDGRCFFPRRTVGGERSDVRRYVRRNRGPAPGSVEERSATSLVMSWEAESCGDVYYRDVEREFLNGMRTVDPDVTVTSISRCGSKCGPNGDARRKGFWAMVQATKAARGNANLTFCWFGASDDGVNRILEHGFGQPDVEDSGDEVYGMGVQLGRPVSLPIICDRLVANEDGERHVLLCRVIAGSTEKVERGSSQCQPSSRRYDSGVDDVLSPRWCIVWSTHMNTHISPECVVSFRLSDHSRGLQLRKATVIPSSNPFSPARMSFSQLLAEIEKALPPSTMRTLDLLFDRYKTKKMGKDVFIGQLRTIAGKKLLVHAIKKLRGWL